MITPGQFNRALTEINESFSALMQRVERLEADLSELKKQADAPKAPKTRASTKK